MDEMRIAKMAEKIAAEQDDQALANIDQAVDSMIAAIAAIEESIPNVKTENVPQKAALDSIQELLDEAIKPYLADIANALSIFSG